MNKNSKRMKENWQRFWDFLVNTEITGSGLVNINKLEPPQHFTLAEKKAFYAGRDITLLIMYKKKTLLDEDKLILPQNPKTNV